MPQQIPKQVMGQVFHLVESNIAMHRNNQRIKIAKTIVTLIVIIPVLLFAIGARNYAAHVLITSLFGAPILVMLTINQMRFESHIKIPEKALKYGKVFFILALILGLVMMFFDKDGIWSPTLYQITASILVASSTIALIFTTK